MEQLKLTPAEYLRVASREYGIPASKLIGRDRTEPLPFIRHVLAWHIYHNCKLSLQQAGKIVGRDHATVVFGNKNVDNRKRDPKINEVYLRLTEAFHKYQHTLPEDRLKIAEAPIENAWRQPLLDEVAELKAENDDLKRRLQFLAEQYSLNDELHDPA